MNDDTISRKAAVNALWKALYAYEDKTEKQFQESEDLDIYDWMVHRVFVQNMSDIDRRIILDLPSVERRGSWVGIDDEPCEVWECDQCGHIVERECPPRFCEKCGARMEGGEEE